MQTKKPIAKLIPVSIDEVKPTKVSRQTTLELMKAQLAPLSNYALVSMWNKLQSDQRAMKLVPLQDVLKSRGIRVKRGSQCTRKFVTDEQLENLRKYGTALAPVKQPRCRKPAPIPPNINKDIVLSKIGKVLLAMQQQSSQSPDELDAFTRKRNKKLVRFLRKPLKARAQTYRSVFQKYVGKVYGAQVVNFRAGVNTFKTMMRVSNKLIELRAGTRKGEPYVYAAPVYWSQLTEVQ